MTLTGRKGTLVVVALVASVCLNLALAGMMAGHRWHGDEPRGPAAWLLRGVPDEARPAAEQIVAASEAQFTAKRALVTESRKRVAELLQADTVDRAQLEAALGDMQARLGEMFQLGQKLTADLAMQMTPEQRKQWAQKWAEDRWNRR